MKQSQRDGFGDRPCNPAYLVAVLDKDLLSHIGDHQIVFSD